MSKIKQANWDNMESGDIDETSTKTTYDVIVLAYQFAPQEELVDDVKNLIEKYGKIWAYDDEGVKKLAYDINNEQQAHYYYWFVENLEDPMPISKYLENDGRVLRYLICRSIQRR